MVRCSLAFQQTSPATRSPTAIRTRAVCGHERILVPDLAGRSLRGAARPRIGFNEVVEIAKDGQSWRIGTRAQIG